MLTLDPSPYFIRSTRSNHCTKLAPLRYTGCQSASAESVNHNQLLALVAFSTSNRPDDEAIQRVVQHYRALRWRIVRQVEYKEPIELGGYTLLTFQRSGVQRRLGAGG